MLEVGTGLGYQAAVLAELAGRVWSVEIVEELALEAEARLRRLGYANVGIRIGDGSRGWAEHAPFDKILVTAAAELMPAALIEQLRPGGRMVLPVGADLVQKLTVLDKDVRPGQVPAAPSGAVQPARDDAVVGLRFQSRCEANKAERCAPGPSVRARSIAVRAILSPTRSASTRSRSSSAARAASHRPPPRPEAARARPRATKKTAQGNGSGRGTLPRLSRSARPRPSRCSERRLHSMSVEP